MTAVSFVVYAFLTLTTVFSPATGHVHTTVNTNTGARVSVRLRPCTAPRSSPQRCDMSAGPGLCPLPRAGPFKPGGR